MQLWSRLYDYIHEYQQLVYEYYAHSAVAFQTTYWNINKDVTVWDDEQMFGGAYEMLGSLSGVKWNKYLLLPVYFSEEITTAFEGTETGLIKEQESSIVIPSEYGITPYAGDIIKLEQEFLRPTNDNFPIFAVTGVEPHPNTDRRFWKLKIKVNQSETVDDINDQTENSYAFYDYDKKIHTLEEATDLTRLLMKNETLRERLKNMWDENSGLYNI